MSDPLSVAAGVVGVVTAAAQISSLLIKFTTSTIAAPQQAKVVLTEVSDISVILSQLQVFLLGLDLPDRSRTSLLKVEKVVTIVSGCVLTFSELEKLLDELKTENMDFLDRLKWVRQESAIRGFIQRLQNHKTSLSLVLHILNGFTFTCLIVLSACMLILRRHNIAEAKDSVDRLHALVESCYKEMSSRVQALEVLSMQQGDTCWTSEEDTKSLATLHAHRPDISSDEIMESELGVFDFSDELQRSRVYTRNQAFRKSVFSTFTISAYSLGLSVFSDLSMAAVSDISVINLAITKGEVFNSGRSLQTWSAQSNKGYSSDDHVDGQRTQPFELAHGRVQRHPCGSIARERQPVSTQNQEQSLPQRSSRLHSSERHNTHAQWKEKPREEGIIGSYEGLDLTSTLSQAELSDSVSPSQVRATSSPQFNQQVGNKAAWPYKGRVEVCFTPSCCLSAKPPCALGQSANDWKHLPDTHEGKGLRTWYVCIIIVMIS